MEEASLQEFCDKLEYYLSRHFRNIDDQLTRGFWCDGVICKPLSYQDLTNDRTIEAKGWLGKDGQNEYKVLISVGQHSMKLFRDRNELNSILPEEFDEENIIIDIQKRILEIYLP